MQFFYSCIYEYIHIINISETMWNTYNTTRYKILFLNLKYFLTFQQTNCSKTIICTKIIFIKMSNKQKYSLLFIHSKKSINFPSISLVSNCSNWLILSSPPIQNRKLSTRAVIKTVYIPDRKAPPIK